MRRLVAALILLTGCTGSPAPESDPSATPVAVDAAALREGPAELPSGPPQVLEGVTGLALGRHIGSVTSYATSPDGKILALGAWDGTVRLFEAGTGALLYLLPDGMTEDVEGIAFSPDGTRVAAVSRNSNGAVWDVRSGARQYELRLHEDSVESVVWSPDGSMLATGSWDGDIRFWDAATGDQQPFIEDAHTEGIFALAFSPDGQRIASGSQEGTTKVWELMTRTLQRELPPHQASVYAVAWSPAGERIATGSRDGTARVVDVASGAAVHEWTLDEHVLAVAFNGDGEVLLTAGWDGRGRLWDTVTGAEITGGAGWAVESRDGALRVAFPEQR